MKRSVKTHEFNNKIWAFSYTREHMGELYTRRSRNFNLITNPKLVYFTCINSHHERSQGFDHALGIIINLREHKSPN